MVDVTPMRPAVCGPVAHCVLVLLEFISAVPEWFRRKWMLSVYDAYFSLHEITKVVQGKALYAVSDQHPGGKR